MGNPELGEDQAEERDLSDSVLHTARNGSSVSHLASGGSKTVPGTRWFHLRHLFLGSDFIKMKNNSRFSSVMF